MRWLAAAAKAAARNENGGYRLGAVAVRGGRLLGRGTNRFRNDPHMCPGAPREAWSVHAEEDCLTSVGCAAGATVYVARVTPAGARALARPCPACWKKLKEAGVRAVVYTTGSGIEAARLEID